jgi:hypothetical protein
MQVSVMPVMVGADLRSSKGAKRHHAGRCADEQSCAKEMGFNYSKATCDSAAVAQAAGAQRCQHEPTDVGRRASLTAEANCRLGLRASTTRCVQLRRRRKADTPTCSRGVAHTGAGGCESDGAVTRCYLSESTLSTAARYIDDGNARQQFRQQMRVCKQGMREKMAARKSADRA